MWDVGNSSLRRTAYILVPPTNVSSTPSHKGKQKYLPKTRKGAKDSTAWFGNQYSKPRLKIALQGLACTPLSWRVAIKRENLLAEKMVIPRHPERRSQGIQTQQVQQLQRLLGEITGGGGGGGVWRGNSKEQGQYRKYSGPGGAVQHEPRSSGTLSEEEGGSS